MFSKEIKKSAEEKMFVFSEAHLAGQRAISNEKSEKHFETLRSFFFEGQPPEYVDECGTLWAKDLSFLMQKPLLFGTHHELLSVIATKLGARS